MMKMAKVHAVPIGTLIVLTLCIAASGVLANEGAQGDTTITAEGGAAKALDRSFTLAVDGTIEVSNVRGSVTIAGGDGNEVKLGGSLGAGSKLSIESNAKRLELHVESGNDGGWLGNKGPRSDTDLVLHVPHGISVKLDVVSANSKVDHIDGKSIEVDNVSGDVAVNGAARSIEIDSVSGDVSMQVMRAGATERTHLQTVSGNIKASGADGRVKLETVSGTVTFTTPSVSELGTESVSGDIDATVTPTKGARIRAETMSGNLRLHLPANVTARIHAETFSGSLRTDFGKVVRAEYGPGSTLDVDGGDSGTRIDAQSFSGSVELRKQ
jgi:hypothetical protein